MPKTKVAVTLDSKLLREVDDLVDDNHFPSRSQLVEAAVAEKVARVRKTRLASECAKLDPAEEVSLAEEGLSDDRAAWPEY
jgi:metal-responsive CopG/Arc/MetJ family transcriptional regulator